MQDRRTFIGSLLALFVAPKLLASKDDAVHVRFTHSELVHRRLYLDGGGDTFIVEGNPSHPAQDAWRERFIRTVQTADVEGGTSWQYQVAPSTDGPWRSLGRSLNGIRA